MLDVDFLDTQKPPRSMPAISGGPSIGALDREQEETVAEYRFSVIVASPPLSHEEILDATDTLGEAGCLDASLRGHAEGMELLFDREADSLQAAISSAVTAIEGAGYRVLRVAMEREAIPLAGR